MSRSGERELEVRVEVALTYRRKVRAMTLDALTEACDEITTSFKQTGAEWAVIDVACEVLP